MTDTAATEEQTLTVDDILEDAEKAPFTPIINVWAEVIKSSKEVRKEKINPQWAERVTSAHRQVFYQDMPEYRDLFYDKIDQLAEALQAEIDTDDECLNYTTAEEDLEHNLHHYINVLFSWQKVILSWELDWDCTSASAAVDLASIIEVHKMFFGETGLVTLLDQIKFEFTESLQEQLYKELEELKENWNADE